MSWEAADWAPGAGIQLHGLAVYRDAARRDRLARVGLVAALKGNLSWLRWDKVLFKAANTELLLGSGATETKLEHMGLSLFIEPGKTDLREFHASFQGFRFEAKCLVDSPPPGAPEVVEAERRAAKTEGLFRNVELAWLESAKSWLQFQPEEDEPVIRLELRSSREENPQTIAVTLEGAKFQWRGQKWDFAQAAVTIPVGRGNGEIEIEHVRIGHEGRKLEMAGAFDPASRLLRIGRIDSGIDALALTRAMNPAAVESFAAVTTRGGWWIDGAGEIPLDHPESLRWRGEMALDGELAYASGGKNIALRKPSFSVRVQEQVVTFSDFRAGLWDGALTVPRMQIHWSWQERKLRMETQLTLDGVRSQSIVNSLGDARRQPASFPVDWTGAWRISGEAEILVDQPERFRWQGEMALDGDLAYANGETKVTVQKPTFSMRVEEQVATISDGKAGLWEGSLAIQKLRVHLPSKEKMLRIETELTLNGVRSQSIVDSFREARKETGGFPLEWMGSWRISGAGEIPWDQPEQFRCGGDIVLDGDLVYASGPTRIALQKPSFSMRVEDRAVAISNLTAGLWDGALNAPKLQLLLPSKDDKLQFETQLTLDDVRLPSIIASFGKPGENAGPLRWKGAWRINGAGEIPWNRPEQLRWGGNMALDGDLVYASGPTRIAFQKPSFSMRVEDRAVAISNLTAGLWDGALNAPKLQVLLPSKDDKLRFETQFTLTGTQARSVRKSLAAGQKQPPAVRLSWTGPLRISGMGEIPLDRPENLRWNGEISLGGDLVYASGKTNVALRKPSFSVREEKQVITISAFKAGLWTGNFQAPRTVIYLASEKKKARFDTQLTVSDARLQSITHDFGGSQKEPGVVRFDWTGGGGFTPASITGAGALSIGEAELCRLPLLGRLSLFFRGVVFGFHKEELSTMTVHHRMAGSSVYLDELKLVSAQVHVEARGAIDLAHEYSQITASWGLQKIPGLLTFFFTWLLDFKGEGPLDSMHWSLKRLSGIHPHGQAEKRAARTGTEEEEADRALKGLIELPGKVVEE